MPWVSNPVAYCKLTACTLPEETPKHTLQGTAALHAGEGNTVRDQVKASPAEGLDAVMLHGSVMARWSGCSSTSTLAENLSQTRLMGAALHTHMHDGVEAPQGSLPCCPGGCWHAADG